jgi:hypothetical protein
MVQSLDSRGLVSRCVSPGIQAGATVPDVRDSTSAKAVVGQTLYQDAGRVPLKEGSSCLLQPIRSLHQQVLDPDTVVVPQQVVTNLNRDVWEVKLRTHPNRQFADDILSYIDHGVPLMFDGPILNQVFPNWKSCDELRTEVKTSMLYDVTRRWKVGPFLQQPFEFFVGSPMGAFSKVVDCKPSKIKTRVIHDLS